MAFKLPGQNEKAAREPRREFDYLPESKEEDKSCKLRVKILSATGLPAKDRTGVSDPFCVCEIVGKSETKCQTQVIRRTLSPVWDEVLVLDAYDPGDSVCFTVMDWDLNTCEFMGTATLPKEELEEWAFEGEVHLFDTSDARSAPNRGSLKVQVHVLTPDGKPVLGQAGGGLMMRLSKRIGALKSCPEHDATAGSNADGDGDAAGHDRDGGSHAAEPRSRRNSKC